ACAECHHHPFDRWSQDDYYGMTGYFNNLAVKPTAGGEALLGEGPAAATNPRTGAAIAAHPLGAKAPTQAPSQDAPAALARRPTAGDTPYFPGTLATGVWPHLMGRGLVEPVDDVRTTNPPTHPELLDALARYTAENRYDVRALVRLITASRVYQLSSQP